VVENRLALDFINALAGPDTLFYVDPPYPWTTRKGLEDRRGLGVAHAYRHEMTDADHRALAAQLHQVAGMVVLSGYACPLYDDELYPDWQRHEKAHFADGARPRTEVVWLNAACSEALRRQSWRLDL
jgi:DNA adenine methylase